MDTYSNASLGNFKLNKFLILVMAAASGITVANLYYIQPLLADIADTFQVTQVSVGFVAMLTQAGYALGMLFLLPLADIKEKKFLIILMLCFTTGALTLMAFSFSIVVLSIAAFTVGFCSVVPQLIVPLAAQLADPKERGKIIGSVMSGLLIGILVSRTSGFDTGFIFLREFRLDRRLYIRTCNPGNRGCQSFCVPYAGSQINLTFILQLFGIINEKNHFLDKTVFFNEIIFKIIYSSFTSVCLFTALPRRPNNTAKTTLFTLLRTPPNAEK